MALQSNQVASFIVGGLFLGMWLWIAGFEHPDAHFLGWGLIGILLAAALYAGRIAHEGVKIAIWVGVGIALGMLVTAAFTREAFHVLSAGITFLGGALIVTGLPAAAWQPVEEEPRNVQQAP